MSEQIEQQEFVRVYELHHIGAGRHVAGDRRDVDCRSTFFFPMRYTIGFDADGNADGRGSNGNGSGEPHCPSTRGEKPDMGYVAESADASDGDADADFGAMAQRPSTPRSPTAACRGGCGVAGGGGAKVDVGGAMRGRAEKDVGCRHSAPYVAEIDRSEVP